ncbi:hypothetical protein ES731_15045 [Psychroflexus gondwanensis]|jgi:Na+/proline symporter|uniref:hypothetical protein n=1 Tax=Psychroflexus gondwanensis TaxID=251 RepID=UPI0011BF2598|nr:hypothetical protein [Psychroflexus gondwanensis]TXE15724.1 hypothetical protein ES731_15045 [Psychroflexus gondwanensis]
MKENELKDKPTEKLKTELSVIKMITGALIGILALLFAVNLYGLIWRENNSAFIAGMFVAFSLSAILPMQFSNMKKIKTELKIREGTN